MNGRNMDDDSCALLQHRGKKSAIQSTVRPIPDNLIEGSETAVFNLAANAGCSFCDFTNAIITIKDKLLAEWQTARLTEAELSDPQISGNLADPDQDGLVNLAEYEFGRNPKQPDAGGLPGPTHLNDF